MKRFWAEVAVTGDGGIVLDGRPVRTPGRQPLSLPSPASAEAVAAEWRAVGETVDPRAMPLTGLANAAIDRVGADRAAFAAGLARYAESDLLCYRAEAPAPLVARQAAAWNPLLAWARARYDVGFTVVTGIMPQPQPAATVARLGEAVAALDTFALTALSPLVTATGSLVIALAVAEQAVDGDAAWSAATIDEAWAAEQWGEDAEAAAALAGKRREFDAGVRFLQLTAR